MGGGKPTFTKRLQELARSVQDLSCVHVNVDGPYGLPIDYSRFRSVLFVAGGIGITPIHSHLRDMWRAAQTRQEGIPDQVRLVWVTRDPSMFESFAATLDLLHQLPRDRFSVELYCSSKKPASGPLLVRSGRPDLAQHISALQLDGMRGLVFVCGPASLSAVCVKLASEHGVAFHSETFEL
jgi:ferredoxin-NADP reductase